MVGVLAEGHRVTGREPGAALGPGLAAVMGHEEGRAPVDEDHDRRADRVDVQDSSGGPRRREAQRALALHGAAGLVACELVLLRGGADLDEVGAVVAAGDGDQRPFRLPSMALTEPLASRAADTGECFRRRYARYEVVHESPAPVGSMPSSGIVGTCSATPSA